MPEKKDLKKLSKNFGKVVVFGGTGFIGRHLVDGLLDCSNEVVLFDLLEPIDTHKNVKFFKGNLLEEEAVEAAVDGADAVFDFAGISDIDECQEKRIDAVKTNVLGTTILLEACAKANVSRFVFASSLYVYSRVGGIYRATKIASEELIEEYSNIFDLPYVILRFGTIYGPNADNRNSVHRYVSQALEKGIIQFPGDGQELREYIHVLDAVHQTIELTKEDTVNQKYLITGNHPTRASGLFELIGEVIGRKIEVEYDPDASGHGSHYQVSPYAYRNQRALKVNNPRFIDLGQGILELVDHLFSRQRF